MAALLMLFACKPKVEPDTTPSADPTEVSNDPSGEPEASTDPSSEEPSAEPPVDPSEVPSVDPGPTMKVKVTTGEAKNVTLDFANLYCSVSVENAPEDSEDSDQDLKDVVVYVSVSPTLKTADDLIEKAYPYPAGSLFDEVLYTDCEELEVGTKHYYVAWLKLGDDIYKGDVKYFSTKKYSDYAEPVDLGLSVKWCNVNIGAMTPKDEDEKSLYFAWGEIEPKWNFTRENYTGNPDLYVGEESSSSKKKLQLSDDAAYKILGRDWKMPTHADFEELLTCSFEYESASHCWKVTGPSGKSIYLPESGLMDGYGYIGFRKCGWYWSSEYPSWEPTLAYSLYLNSTNSSPNYTQRINKDGERYVGCPIRAVYRGE